MTPPSCKEVLLVRVAWQRLLLRPLANNTSGQVVLLPLPLHDVVVVVVALVVVVGEGGGGGE